jgi:hypothetical protein
MKIEKGTEKDAGSSHFTAKLAEEERERERE